MFTGMNAFETSKNTMKAANQGKAGLFEMEHHHAFTQLFASALHDQVLTTPSASYARWDYAIYDLSLPMHNDKYPYAPDDFVLEAIQALPPEYNNETRAIFDAFIKNW